MLCLHSALNRMPILLFAVLSLVACQSGPKKFAVDFIRSDLDLNNANVIRSTPGYNRFYYYDDFNAGAHTGTQAIRQNIKLTATRTLNQVEIFEDFFIGFANCDDNCGWEDIWGKPMPMMYVPEYSTLTSYSGSEKEINGLNASDISVFNPPVTINGPNPETELLVRRSDLRPVRANVRFEDTWQRFDFFLDHGEGFTESVTASEVRQNCTEVDPKCWRQDVVLVLDYSGSVGGYAVENKKFALGLAKDFRIAERYTWFSVYYYNWIVYRQCTLQHTSAGANSCGEDLPEVGDSATNTVTGMGMAYLEFTQRGRWISSKLLVVVTDGVGNLPCTNNASFNPQVWPVNCYCNYSPCQTCPGQGNCCDCTSSHEQLVEYLYKTYYKPGTIPFDKFSAYAIGVGGGIDYVRLNRIANEESKNVIQVASYAELQTTIDRILANLLCENPGRFFCPNDCLPGGFCCGSACTCIEDCAALGNDCQIGYCEVTPARTSCKFTPPDNNLCYDANPCTSDICADSFGCFNFPDNSQTCSDGLPCTDDICKDGVCIGTPNANNTCDDGFPCTTDKCVSDKIECQSTTITCADSNTKDCVVFFCDPLLQECVEYKVSEGERCNLVNEPADKSLVEVCQGGSCVERERDADGCTPDDPPKDNTPGIVGGTVGGAAAASAAGLGVCLLLCLLCIILAIILAIALTIILIAIGLLSAVGLSSVSGLAGGAETMQEVVESPLHQEAAVEAQSALYE